MTSLSPNSFADTAPRIADDLEVARDLYRKGEYRACIKEARSIRLGAGKRSTKMAALLLESSAWFDLNAFVRALRTLEAGNDLVDSVSPLLRSKFFAQRAAIRRKRNDDRQSDKDAALIDYEAARIEAEEAGDDMVIASIQNNLAKLYSEFGRYDDAISASDDAIQAARASSSTIWLGRFYDQRAQVLLDFKDHAGAVQFSEKALRLLAGHPTERETRETHGKALIGLGAGFLEGSDPLESLRSRRQAVRILNASPDTELIKLALARSDGHVRQAAALLGMRHSALSKVVRQKGLTRQPIRSCRKSLIKREK